MGSLKSYYYWWVMNDKGEEGARRGGKERAREWRDYVVGDFLMWQSYIGMDFLIWQVYIGGKLGLLNTFSFILV